jgi:nicotinate-nucleotide adenylyltransferase
MTARIGLFGGCFNPVHRGHIAAAQAARDHLALDRVIFIPSGHPPLKGAAGLAAGADRLAMLELALRSEPDMEASDIEIRREGPSYTVDTVRTLRAAFPAGAELFFLLGGDCLARLPQWKGIGELRAMVRFAAFPRGGQGRARSADDLIEVPMPEIAVSSTLVRERCAQGQPLDGLVPEPVAAYLKRHQTYAASQHTSQPDRISAGAAA